MVCPNKDKPILGAKAARQGRASRPGKKKEVDKGLEPQEKLHNTPATVAVGQTHATTIGIAASHCPIKSVQGKTFPSQPLDGTRDGWWLWAGYGHCLISASLQGPRVGGCLYDLRPYV